MATVFETPFRTSHDLNGLRAEDFETASIRSAAPSYISDAPSYHTTVSNHETIPAYSPPAPGYSLHNNTNGSSTPGPGPVPQTNSAPTLLPSDTSHIPTPGLPPIPPVPSRSNSDFPSMGAFRIPSWSAVNASPTIQRVANRRMQAAAASRGPSSQGLLRAARALDRVEEENRAASGSESPSSRTRPLEDPYLVGEEAAARARRERLARENGDAVLVREDRRWDWFLAQMNDWDERETSWKSFRRDVESHPRGKLARRIAALGR